MAYNMNLQQSECTVLSLGCGVPIDGVNRLENWELCIKQPVRIIEKLLYDGLENGQHNKIHPRGP